MRKQYRIYIALLCLLLLLVSCRSNAASDTLSPMDHAAGNAVTRPIIDPASEVRGVWIASVYNIDYPSRTDLSAEELKAELDAILATCEKNRLNTIFFQVRPACDALYTSEIFPVSSYLSTNGTLAFDPLEYLVRAAHEKNIFIHAWVNPLRVSMKNDLNALPENSPARQNPDWVVPYADGRLYLNAGLPEVRQLVVDGVREIVSKYDVDGIVFDDYFYPYPANNADGTPGVFDDAGAYAMYGGDYGNIADWRRHNINTLVRSVYETVKETDKDCLFGVSPFGIWQNDNGKNGGSATRGFEGYHSLYCDALAWAHGGYVDYLSPQLYWQFSTEASAFDILLRWWNTALDNTGVDLYVSHASYRYEEGEWADPTDELAEQVSFARSELTYKGSVFYGYDEINRNIRGASDDLLQVYTNEIIYPAIQSNALTPAVNSPANGATMTDKTTYVLGVSDPAYPLYLDGEKVGRTKSGYFSLMLELEEGQNNFVFTQNGTEYVYTLYYKSSSVTAQADKPTVLETVGIIGVYPSTTLTTSADSQWISCIAPVNSEVTVTLDGKTAVLKMNETPSVTYTENGYIGVVYGGMLELPEVGEEEVRTVGKAVISVRHPNGTASAETADIRVMGEKARLAVRVISDYAELKFTETSSYYNDYTVQSEGMTDYVVSQKNGFYKLRMGGYIAEHFVEETEDYPTELTQIRKAEVINAGNHTEFRITTEDKPAYYGNMDGGRFIVTFYNIDADTAPDVKIGPNPLFTDCEVIRLPESNRVRYSFTMADERNFYGFDLHYEDGVTVVTCRNPRILFLDGQKPLDGVDIVLDAGHGGTDGGAKGAHAAGFLNEKDLNLQIVLETAARLEELGASVSLIRSDDTTVSLYERMDYLEAAEPELCISVHQNSMNYFVDITRVRGVLPLYCADSGKLLAEKVGKSVADATGRMFRDPQYQMLALCRNPKFPQTLIEVGFITCVEEYEQMATGVGITQIAEGIVKGVLDYFAAQAEFAKGY